MSGHPETVDPQWFQELTRRAFEREMRRLMRTGVEPDEALERAMWWVFDVRKNLTDLYEASAGPEST